MTTTTATERALRAQLHEERDWYAVAIADAVSAGLTPRDEDVAAYRTARTSLHAHLGITNRE